MQVGALQALPSWYRCRCSYAEAMATPRCPAWPCPQSAAWRPTLSELCEPQVPRSKRPGHRAAHFLPLWTSCLCKPAWILRLLERWTVCPALQAGSPCESSGTAKVDGALRACRPAQHLSREARHEQLRAGLANPGHRASQYGAQPGFQRCLSAHSPPASPLAALPLCH